MMSPLDDDDEHYSIMHPTGFAFKTASVVTATQVPWEEVWDGGQFT